MEKKLFYIAPESKIIYVSDKLLENDVPLSYDPNPNDDPDDWGAKKQVWDDFDGETGVPEVELKNTLPW